MKTDTKVLWIALALIFLSPLGSTWAGVNLKNGNYYISYTDLMSPPPAPGQVAGKLEIVRTYNSYAYKVSEFGYGWGWDYATTLKPDGEGGVTVYENLSGMRAHFGAGRSGRGTPESRRTVRPAGYDGLLVGAESQQGGGTGDIAGAESRTE